MNYNLSISKPANTASAFRKMFSFMKDEKKNLFFAWLVMLGNSGTSLLTPFLIGYTIDHYIQNKNLEGLLTYCALIFALYVISAVLEYFQTQLMGSIGQRMLFRLRNEVFQKIQSLPVAFFNQNKAGDLISRINNDTDSVNQFFSQSLMRFVDSVFIMLLAAVFLLAINLELGGAGLIPAIFILLFVRILSPMIRRRNAVSLQKFGNLSGEISESLGNFKIIVAFNRRDFFLQKFQLANEGNYKAAIGAGLVNVVFIPVFTLFSNIAQLIVLVFGIYQITQGNFTIGLLISFLSYTQIFYEPLRQIASLWANFQTAMAAWDRISVILHLESNLKILPGNQPVTTNEMICFDHVSFSYGNGREVLHNIHFKLLKGKTYALVGPTGGGKSTTAALIARLYDPTKGTVYLDGRDIRTYSDSERTKKIGFILQEPFLFNGTILDNLTYGSEELLSLSSHQLTEKLQQAGIDQLLLHFEQGLETPVESNGDSMSLGQKQMIAFARAVLKAPELLILDEATANIDTITEQLLEDILQKLPPQTTLVIIAHRLNTIANADEIFFVNSGNVIAAGTMEDALNLLLTESKES